MFFTGEERPGTSLFMRETTQYPYDTINDLQDVFNDALKNELDFALISFGNGFPTSLPRLAALLRSEELQKSIWSFRICVMTGVGFRHWPRLPNVDDHFIVLNVRRATESGYFGRKLINASHFSDAGGRSSQITSMIEYSMDKDEFSNHFVAEASRDQYGRMCPFNSMPFHLCESTGFLSCYSGFKPALFKLMERNILGHRSGSNISLTGLSYYRRSEFSYFRQLINPGPVMNVIKRPFAIGRFEFQKGYLDEQ